MSDDEWLAAPAADPVATTTPTSRRTLAVRAGLVAAGALVGGLVVMSMHHDSTAAATPTSFFGPPGGAGQFAGPPQGGPALGGLAGEQRLSGTLVSVGTDSVTMRTSRGRATYSVTSATEVVRNGRVADLSALRAGDAVLVHVLPSSTGSGMTVERIFADGNAT